MLPPPCENRGRTGSALAALQRTRATQVARRRRLPPDGMGDGRGGMLLRSLGLALPLHRRLVFEQPDEQSARDEAADMRPERDAAGEARLGVERGDPVEKLLSKPHQDQDPCWS